MLRHIVPLLPPHRVYVEPFAGGLSVLIGKQLASLEVANDLHGALINSTVSSAIP